MKNRCCVLALLAAIALTFVGSADAFGPRRVYFAPGAGAYYYAPVPAYGYYYNPYVVPPPAYNILPAPLATMQMWSAAGIDPYGYRAWDDDAYHGRLLTTPPKKRATLYPAVPFKPEPDPVGARIVHFVVNVPYADATVTINGLPTKETGLTRRFKTTPLPDNDEKITLTFEARWTKDDGAMTLPRTKTATFTPRQTQTIEITFTE